MSAQPVERTEHAPIERTPEAVRAALPPTERARFDTAWRAALDEARTTPTLAGLQKVIGDYWAIASALHSPTFPDAIREGRRWQAGRPVDSRPAGEIFSELGIYVE